jgi:predicted nucleotidyltransferase
MIRTLPIADPRTAEALAQCVERLRACHDPMAIWAFGSSVKGTAHSRSDLDLIVWEESDLPARLRGRSFREVSLGLRPRADPLFLTEREIRHHLANPFSFLSTVSRAAVRLYLRSGVAPPF